MNLLNAPARLSDLHGDDRVIALRQRHDQARANWLAARARKPLLRRVFGL